MSADYVIAIGIDPGFAKTGLAAVALYADGRIGSCGVDMVVSHKNNDKEFAHVRQGVLDLARIELVYAETCKRIELLHPAVIGVETYTIFDSDEYVNLRKTSGETLEMFEVRPGALPTLETFHQTVREKAPALVDSLRALAGAVDKFKVVRGRGDASKTYGTFIAVCAAAWRHGIPVLPFTPVDLKKFATGRSKASKEEVASALGSRVEGLNEAVARKRIPRGLQEHVYDASGHALMAIVQISTQGLKVAPQPVQLNAS